MILVKYGSTEPIPFKATLSGVGQTGLTFSSNDVRLSKDGGTFSNIGSEVSEVGLGWYIWTPSVASQTQCKFGIINIKDALGSQFDENGITFYTGGDATGAGRYPG